MQGASRFRSKQLAVPASRSASSVPAATGVPFLASAVDGEGSDKAPSLRAALRAGQTLEAALTPHYPIGCKRVTPSDEYLRTFTRPNVALVTRPILRVEEDAIVVGSQSDETRLPVDVIIYTTGFDVVGSMLSGKAVGRGGQPMTREWAVNADSYYGESAPTGRSALMSEGLTYYPRIFRHRPSQLSKSLHVPRPPLGPGTHVCAHHGRGTGAGSRCAVCAL